MASTQEMQRRAKERKAQAKRKVAEVSTDYRNKPRNRFIPVPSKTTNYGKLVKSAIGYDGSTVSIYRANQLGLDNYKLATGFLPYEIEFAEDLGMDLDAWTMKQLFGVDRATSLKVECSWRDHLLVISNGGKDYAYGFRVAYDNKPITVDVPAYSDTVTLSAIGAGLCRMAITGSQVSQYAFVKGEGPNDCIQTGGMSWICGNEVATWCEAAKLALDAFKESGAFRYLD